MSRRFGRNQRRRAREQIAQVQLGLSMANGLLDYQRARNQQMEQELNWARCHLAHYTFALHPNKVRVQRDPNPHQETIQVERRAPFTGQHPLDTIGPEHVVVEALPVMIARAKIDKTNGDLHVKVVYANGLWGYAIKQSAFLHQDQRLMVGIVSDQLSQMIFNEMRSSQ